VRKVWRYSGCTVLATTIFVRRPREARMAIIAASANALAPSYIDTLATSMPVSSQSMLWNSKPAVNVPWLISGW